MKIVILAIVSLIISGSVNAQIDSMSGKKSPPYVNDINPDSMDQKQVMKNNSNQDMKGNPDSISKYNSKEMHPDGAMMRDGKMWMIQNNSITALNRTLTMSNGTKVMSDGYYTNKEGTKRKFKEGEKMDMTGKLIPVK